MMGCLRGCVSASFLGVTLLCSIGRAVPLNVPAFSTITVSPGQEYDYATVQSNGVLIMNGGVVGITSAPTPSVTVSTGGRFYMNAGLIQFFDNRGVAELYGGSQSTFTSENRGYVKIAGYDPGIQLAHYTGTVEVFHLATNRTNWEIISEVTDGAPVIRFFSLTNTLAAGTYTVATLPKTTLGNLAFHTNHAQFWNPLTNTSVRTDVNMRTTWPGTVEVLSYVPVSPIAITCRVQSSSTVFPGNPEVFWNTESGRVYQVERALDLGLQDWVAPLPPVTATGDSERVFATGILPQMLFRVLLRH